MMVPSSRRVVSCTNMPKTSYYIRRQGVPAGPFTGESLKAMAADGSLQPGDLVWKEGAPKWIEARRVRGLFIGGSVDAKQTGPKPDPEAVLGPPREGASKRTAASVSGTAVEPRSTWDR